MFISADEIKEATGVELDANTVRVAQLMIETWVGRSEVEIEDGSDLAALSLATMWQALYINNSVPDILEQAATKSITLGDTSTTFDTSLFSPYMAPWAIKACKSLSWHGPRLIKTGPLFDRPATVRWETE